jgi:glycosyltransferase involved in cell wall biosynthesis
MEAYVRNLLREFVALGRPEELRVLVGTEAAGQFAELAGHVTEFVADRGTPSGFRYGRSIAQWWSATRELRRWRPDVLHCTMFFPRPAWAGRNMVLTVHDLHFVNVPYTCGPLTAKVMDAHCRVGVRRAGRVIADSEFVKRDLVAHYGLPADRIDVVYLAVDHEQFRPPTDPTAGAEFRRRLGLPERFLLYPANTWPHKNHERLLEALAILRDRNSLSIPLVLTGARKRGDDAIETAARRFGLTGSVLRLEYVSLDDLVRCYQSATATVFPSLHEGFGLPVVEAMACGCPVACSTTTSVGEIAGTAAELFDPTSADAIAAAVRRVWEDDGRRDHLRAAGLDRARGFTWRRTALDTLDSYAKITRH